MCVCVCTKQSLINLSVQTEWEVIITANEQIWLNVYYKVMRNRILDHCSMLLLSLLNVLSYFFCINVIY